MDFSKVKKLVITEGEVQSITIADKVVWTKPQDKKWNVIVPKTTVRSNYSRKNEHVKIVKADLTKSKLFRFTIKPLENPSYYYSGVDTITAKRVDVNESVTFELSLDATGDGRVDENEQRIVYYGWYSEYGNAQYGTEICIEVKTGQIYSRSWYFDLYQPYDTNYYDIEIEQFY